MKRGRDHLGKKRQVNLLGEMNGERSEKRFYRTRAISMTLEGDTKSCAIGISAVKTFSAEYHRPQKRFCPREE